MSNAKLRYSTRVSKWAWALALAGGVGLMVAASAGADDHTSAAQADADGFEMLLRSIDELPPSRGALEARWPDAKARLLAAAQDDSRDSWTRLRAMSFLSFFVDADVRVALLDLADHRAVEVRRLALYTVGRAFGRTGDAALVQRLEAAMKDPSDEVAAHAVRALRWVDHGEALFALERIRASGRSAELRQLADVTITKRARRLAATPE